MSAEALIASYLRIGNEDLEGARAVLTSEGKNAGIKHQLDEMVDLIPDENPQDLADYATSYRYPSPKGRIKTPPTKAAFDEHAAAVQLALAALAMFGVDLAGIERPAKTAGPLR